MEPQLEIARQIRDTLRALKGNERLNVGDIDGLGLYLSQVLAGRGGGGGIPYSQKGVADGVATLDADGYVPSSQIRDSIPADWVFVDSKADLPTAVAGVITLEDNYTYVFTSVVDLTGDRLVCGQNTTLLGGSSENCRIKSTGLTGTALITSEWSLPIRGLTIEADIALDLDANGNANQAIDWFGVNFTDCGAVGTIANYNNFIMTDAAFLNSGGLTFDGTISTVGFIQCLFDPNAGSTMITLPATANITRRFRIIYSSFVVLSGETGLNVSTSATIPNESYILDTVNFSGGGTYITGVPYTDNKARFSENRGIENSASIGYYTMNNNATATTISATNTPVKGAGTTVNSAFTQKFNHSNNRLTYTGSLTQTFKVSANMSIASTANNVIGLYIAKNGTPINESETYVTANSGGRFENGYIHTVLSLSTNDYIEIWVENNTAINNITLESLSVIVNVQS